MKKLLILAFVLCSAVCVQAQDMTVASFNIRYQNEGDCKAGNGWEQRSPYVCGLIEFQGFDLFGAQEVLHAQLKDMQAQLPDYDYIGVGRDDGKTEGEYAPIFYKRERFELLDSGHFWLSKITDRPNKGWDAVLPRICTWGYFLDKQTDRRFWFFNLHMDHVGVKARAESAKLVVAKIRQMCAATEPVILTGDFNVDQNDETYTLFVESGVLCDSYIASERRYAPNGTFNAFDSELKTDSRIDHIFVSPSFGVTDYGVLTDTYRSPTTESAAEIKSGNFPKEVSLHPYRTRMISDHFPIAAKLKFGEYCTAQHKAEFQGHWIEIMPANSQFIQGLTLNADGGANSIGMRTLKYEQWHASDNQLILKGKSIGNGQTIDFTDTLHVISITADSMILGKSDTYRIGYYRVDAPGQMKPFDVLDSLKKETNLGKLLTRVYKGILPAASCAGIEYTVTLYNYEYSGDGVYRVVLNYLEVENGQDLSVERVGRMYTLRGDAEDDDATVYQLIPFSGGSEMSFLYSGDKLELLNTQFERSESGLKLCLKLN